MASKRKNLGDDSYSPGSRPLDDADRRILREVAANPREPVARLASRIGMSRPAVADRLRRLEKDRVITGWNVDLDPAALGFRYTVFIRIRPSAGQSPGIESLIRGTPAVVECYRMTGEEGLLLKALFSTVPEFEDLFSRLQRYGQATAFDVLSAVVYPRTPPLPAPSGPH